MLAGTACCSPLGVDGVLMFADAFIWQLAFMTRSIVPSGRLAYQLASLSHCNFK